MRQWAEATFRVAAVVPSPPAPQWRRQAGRLRFPRTFYCVLYESSMRRPASMADGPDRAKPTRRARSGAVDGPAPSTNGRVSAARTQRAREQPVARELAPVRRCGDRLERGAGPDLLLLVAARALGGEGQERARRQRRRVR